MFHGWSSLRAFLSFSPLAYWPCITVLASETLWSAIRRGGERMSVREEKEENWIDLLPSLTYSSSKSSNLRQDSLSLTRNNRKRRVDRGDFFSSLVPPPLVLHISSLISNNTSNSSSFGESYKRTSYQEDSRLQLMMSLFLLTCTTHIKTSR